MGQGEYQKVAFGMIGSRETMGLTEEQGETVVDIVYKNGGRPAYECETPYLAVPIFESSGANGKGSKPFPQEAVPLDGFAAWIKKRAGARLKVAEKKWNTIRKAAAAKGINLPEGVLFWAQDYD